MATPASALPSLPPALSPPLNPREAITDSLYRSITGLDTPDLALFESAFTQDVCFEINGRTVHGMEQILANFYERTARLDTTHFVTNVRIHIADNEVEAKMTASALAYHYRPGTGRQPGAPQYLTGSAYNIDLVNNDKDGLWKMKKFEKAVTWSEGDHAVITGEGG